MVVGVQADEETFTFTFATAGADNQGQLWPRLSDELAVRASGESELSDSENERR